MLVGRLKAVKKDSAKIETTLHEVFENRQTIRAKKKKRRGSPEEEEKPRATAHCGGSGSSQRWSIRDDCQFYSVWFNKGQPLPSRHWAVAVRHKSLRHPSTRMCLNPYWAQVAGEDVASLTADSDADANQLAVYHKTCLMAGSIGVGHSANFSSTTNRSLCGTLNAP